ncbi:N-acetyltransferase cml2, partial [Globisporangium splendens]
MAQRRAPAPPLALEIRQFRAQADQAAVLALFEEGMLAYADHGASADSLAYIQRSMETDLADIPGAYIKTGGNFWVAIDEAVNEIVGMIALEKTCPGAGELRRMSVRHEYRRFGVGTCLVHHLEEWAKTNKFTSVSLTTGEVMLAAQQFYANIGYKKQGIIVRCEDPYYADVLFVKKL